VMTYDGCPKPVDQCATMITRGYTTLAWVNKPSVTTYRLPRPVNASVAMSSNGPTTVCFSINQNADIVRLGGLGKSGITWATRIVMKFVRSIPYQARTGHSISLAKSSIGEMSPTQLSIMSVGHEILNIFENPLAVTTHTMVLTSFASSTCSSTCPSSDAT
jgi:hypothetical protein